MYSNFILYIPCILISSYLFDSSIGLKVGKVLLIEAILPVICTVLVDVLMYYFYNEYQSKYSYLEDIYIFEEMLEVTNGVFRTRKLKDRNYNGQK